MTDNSYGIKVSIDASASTEGAREFKRSADDVAASAKRASEAGKGLKEDLSLLKDRGVQDAFEGIHSSTELLRDGLNLLGLTGVALEFRELIDASVDLEAAFTHLQIVAGLTDEAMEGVKNQVRALSDEVGVSQINLIASQARAAADGFKTMGEQAEIAKAAVDLSKVLGTTNYAGATKTLADLTQAFHLSAEDSERVAASLAVTVNNTGLSLQQLGQQLNRLAPTAKDAGLGIDDLLKTVVLLKDAGEQGYKAMAGMRAILQAVGEPTPVASQHFQELSRFLREAGSSATSFKELVGERGLVGALALLKQASGNSDQTFKGLVGGTQAAIAANDLLRLSTEKVADVQQQFANGQVSFDHALSLVGKTASEQGDILKNKLQNQFLELTNAIIPALTAALKFLNDNFETIGPVIEAVALVLSGRLAIATLESIGRFLAMGQAAVAGGASAAAGAGVAVAAAEETAASQTLVVEAVAESTASFGGLAEALDVEAISAAEAALSAEALADAFGAAFVAAQVLGAGVTTLTAELGAETAIGGVAAVEIGSLGAAEGAAVGVTELLSGAMGVLSTAVEFLLDPVVLAIIALTALIGLREAASKNSAFEKQLEADAKGVSALTNSMNDLKKAQDTEQLDKLTTRLKAYQDQLRGLESDLDVAKSGTTTEAQQNNPYIQKMEAKINELKSAISNLEKSKSEINDALDQLDNVNNPREVRSIQLPDNSVLTQRPQKIPESFADQTREPVLLPETPEEQHVKAFSESLSGVKDNASLFGQSLGPIIEVQQNLGDVVADTNTKLQDQFDKFGNLVKVPFNADAAEKFFQTFRDRERKAAENRSTLEQLNSPEGFSVTDPGLAAGLGTNVTKLARQTLVSDTIKYNDEQFKFDEKTKGEEGKYDAVIAATNKYNLALRALNEAFQVSGDGQDKLSAARARLKDEEEQGVIAARGKLAAEVAVSDQDKQLIDLTAKQDQATVLYTTALKDNKISQEDLTNVMNAQALAREKIIVDSAALESGTLAVAKAELALAEGIQKANEQHLDDEARVAFLAELEVAVTKAGQKMDTLALEVRTIAGAYEPWIDSMKAARDQLVLLNALQNARPDLTPQIDNARNLAGPADKLKTDQQLALPAADSAVIIATDKYDETLSKLNAELNQGVISQDQFNQAVLEAKENMIAATAAFDPLTKAIEDYSKTAGDALTRYLINPSEGLKGLWKDLAKQFQEIAAKDVSDLIKRQVFGAAAGSDNPILQTLGLTAAAGNGTKLGNPFASLSETQKLRVSLGESANAPGVNINEGAQLSQLDTTGSADFLSRLSGTVPGAAGGLPAAQTTESFVKGSAGATAELDGLKAVYADQNSKLSAINDDFLSRLQQILQPSGIGGETVGSPLAASSGSTLVVPETGLTGPVGQSGAAGTPGPAGLPGPAGPEGLAGLSAANEPSFASPEGVQASLLGGAATPASPLAASSIASTFSEAPSTGLSTGTTTGASTGQNDLGLALTAASVGANQSGNAQAKGIVGLISQGLSVTNLVKKLGALHTAPLFGTTIPKASGIGGTDAAALSGDSTALTGDLSAGAFDASLQAGADAGFANASASIADSGAIDAATSASADVAASAATDVAAEELPDLFAVALADGGLAHAHRTHIVGERGPELFVPHVAGTVVPNHELGMRSSDTRSHLQNILHAANETHYAADGGAFEEGAQVYVGERGPELIKFGAPGRVIPNQELHATVYGGNHKPTNGADNPAHIASPRALTVHQQFIVQGTPDRRTQEQVAAAASNGLTRANRRAN